MFIIGADSLYLFHKSKKYQDAKLASGSDDDSKAQHCAIVLGLSFTALAVISLTVVSCGDANLASPVEIRAGSSYILLNSAIKNARCSGFKCLRNRLSLITYPSELGLFFCLSIFRRY